MPTDVIAFPPVGVLGSMWTVAAPIMVSRSMRPATFGKRYVSRMGRERHEAMVNISALSLNRSGAGFSHMLTRYLDGGANLVRLNSQPINWHLDHQRLKLLRSSQPLSWTTDGSDLAWQNDGNPMYWFTGRVVPGVVSGDLLTVSGLPPRMLIARPADFVRVFGTIPETEGAIAQIVTEVWTDENGVAVLKLFDPLPAGTYPRVNIGDSDSRVFEVTEMPRSPQPVGQNWFYQWNFKEVFADEVDGFNEVNPW